MKQLLDPNSYIRADLDMWITLARSMLAIMLGVVMIVSPDRSERMLGNFIGGFWIGLGILSIRWGFADQRSKPLTLVMGMAAIVAGALTYSRNILRHWMSENTVIMLLGGVAILTGLLHLTGQIPVSRIHHRQLTRSKWLLGIFEIGLGVAILWQGRGELMYEVMAVWALVGGVVLLTDGLYMHRQIKLMAESTLESKESVERPS